MKKIVNGELFDLTEEEIAALKAVQAAQEAYELTRPRTPEEILTALMAAIEGGLSDGS